jgi:Helicase HerA, central domain
MPTIELFPRNQVVGIFRGFREGGLEFHADLVLPYRIEFQSIPMHGQFILVQLETPDEAVLGRIASFSSEGKLSSGYGEEFNLRALRENRSIPDDLREEYLKYKVNIRVLGVLRNSSNGELSFVASHRRLPHVGSSVAFPSSSVLQEIAGHNLQGAEIGHFALGEYIYSYGSKDNKLEDWMQIKSPEVLIKFPVTNLVSRRSFIFARAGFGKSNLNKLLFSKLYEQTPTVTKRGGRAVPVGTVLFDPDGEYFWPDHTGRPGLCDVPELQDKLVVFTPRNGPSEFYKSFVAGSIKLDIRRLNPSDVIAIALSPERQDQQNVRKLRGLSQRNWEALVNLIDQGGNQTPLDDISNLLGLESRQQEVEALAARANMTTIVQMLHDKSSQFMDMLIHALSEGKLCIVDVSQMRGNQALILSGLILRRIFDRNQAEFTKAEPKTIPTIAVVEEAQSVLNERASAAEPYITWVKEGRKYDLGALLITQQPGSIPVDILSQGDNWFIFHLLSTTDLTNVQRANAHFSEDILSVLLNEPIPGQGVFWSSVGGKPYPVSIRVLSFEHMYSALDPFYNKQAVDTFAQTLKAKFQSTLKEQLEQISVIPNLSEVDKFFENGTEVESIDALAVYENNAIEALRNNRSFIERINGEGIQWGRIIGLLEAALPDTLEDRGRVARNLVVKALEQILGPKNETWHDFMGPKRDGGQTPWVKAGKRG